jgi:hypothetical protein
MNGDGREVCVWEFGSSLKHGEAAGRTGVTAHGTSEKWPGCGEGPSTFSTTTPEYIQSLEMLQLHVCCFLVFIVAQSVGVFES